MPAPFLRFVSFGLVGASATLIYAALAFAFGWLGLAPVAASALAYTCAAILSYLAQKRFTFRSALAHQIAVPRFIMSSAIGYSLAFLAPFIIIDHWHWPAIGSIAFVCIAVPLLNFVLLDRFVFHRAECEPAS